VPAFGLRTHHWHYGCAGYDSNSLRIYAIKGKTLQAVVPDIATESSGGMCQADCESRSTYRSLKFASQPGKPYPDLVVHETHQEVKDDPKGRQGVCETIDSEHEYKLRFNGSYYPVTEDMGF
jgi:hypothetical protein